MEVNLRADQEAHLKQLCEGLGRSVDDFASKAILSSMEDYEDSVEAQAILARVKSGEEGTVSLEELMKRYALEDRDISDRREAVGSTGQAEQRSDSNVSTRKSSHAA
jgi:RHH-type rel operon transcriptional repressor/antitoxin RelB